MNHRPESKSYNYKTFRENIGVNGGVDALWATVQMPSGIPVATVAIDGAANAALLAVQMLALSDEALYEKLVLARKSGEEKVLEKNKAIEEKFNA